jgi:hypothetical protein
MDLLLLLLLYGGFPPLQFARFCVCVFVQMLWNFHFQTQISKSNKIFFNKNIKILKIEVVFLELKITYLHSPP